jgi:SPX domain protein involved in polyphosphate accumulation
MVTPVDSGFEVTLDRYEAKYLIAPELLPEIRAYLRSFCSHDQHSKGENQSYTVTTLQLDTPTLSLHHAKPNRALTRFKLRVRTYGTDGKAPVFLEIKRKIRGSVVKSRAMIPPEAWGKELIDATHSDLAFRNEAEARAYYEFIRLTRQTGSRPSVRIRYERESFFGRVDRYARVTFDTHLCYQRADDWSVLGGTVWRSMDTALSQNKHLPYSAVVLELKSLEEPPLWMVSLVEIFGLTRCGNCKYSTAIRNEAWVEGFTSDREDIVHGL